MVNRLLAALVFGALLTVNVDAATTAGMSAAPNGPPTGPAVQIQSCLIHTPGDGSARVLATGALGYLASRISNGTQALALAGGSTVVAVATAPSLVIQLSNESGVTADIVRIRVRAPDGSIGYIRDVARFEPGIVVQHTFKTGAGLSGTSFFSGGPTADECTVDWIHFSNDSVWHSTQ